MTYENEFNAAVDFTLRSEGVLSNNPNDSGGLTKFGVTQATWTAYLSHVAGGVSLPRSVAQITVDQAIDCYHIVFWNETGIVTLPRELQGPAFDCAVNSGPALAIKAIQSAVGVTADGQLGPATLAKVTTLQPSALRKVRNDAVTYRLIFDADLVQHNAKDVTFIEGWVRRVTKLYDFAY